MEWWVLIPIFGILAGAFSEWLKVRSKQQALGASAQGLEKEVATLRRENDLLVERVQNLEAIVVSQTWEVLSDRNLPASDRERRAATVASRELAPETSDLHRRRAEQLARRLGG